MKLSRIILATAIAGMSACTSLQASKTSSAPLAPAAPTAVQYPIITKIVGRHQTIVISAGPKSALYSIQSPTGQLLLANASFEELRDKHPEYFRYIQPLVANDATVILSADVE